MQLERTPEPGQIWQHYKVNDYKILLVTGKDTSIKRDDITLSFNYIFCSETGKKLQLLFSKSLTGVSLLDESKRQLVDPHVIYQRVDLNFPQVWARPLDNFLETIDTGVFSMNYARFTRLS